MLRIIRQDEVHICVPFLDDQDVRDIACYPIQMWRRIRIILVPPFAGQENSNHGSVELMAMFLGLGSNHCRSLSIGVFVESVNLTHCIGGKRDMAKQRR